MERFKKFNNARKARRTRQLGGWIAKGRTVRALRREASAIRFLNLAFG